MDISDLTLKLIFILIPGAMAGLVFEKLTIHRPWNNFKFISHSILFGLLAYLVTGWMIEIVNSVFNASLLTLKIWDNLSSKEIPFAEIGKATITGIIMGFIASAIDHYKLINRLASWLRITNKYGDINLYSHFLNSVEIKEAYFIDLRSDFIYHGIIESYFETDEIKEIILVDLTVYQNKNRSSQPMVKLYQVDAVYLSRPKDDVVIEISLTNLHYANKKTITERNEELHGGKDEVLDEKNTSCYRQNRPASGHS